jgi:hypothetical protein
MKFPARFQALGLIGLVVSIIMLFYGIATLIDILKYSEKPVLVELFTSSLFTSGGLWLLVSSIAWIGASKSSYVYLYSCAAGLIMPIITLYLSLNTGESNTGVLIFMCIYLVYPLSMILITLISSTRAWVKDQGPAVKVIFHPAIIIIFLLLTGFGPASFRYLDLKGMYIPCSIRNVSVSSSLQHNWPYTLIDGKTELAWIPWTNPSGRNEWIDLVLDETTDINVVEIFPGAYSSTDKNAFGSYNRIKSGYLLFEDGLKIPFTLEDKNSAQRIVLTPVKTGKLRIVITDVFNGSLEQVLHVSEIAVLKHTRRFR